MGEKGVCCRCKTRLGVSAVEIYDKNTGRQICYRCGWVGFCQECLPIAQSHHPEHVYMATDTIPPIGYENTTIFFLDIQEKKK